MKTHSPPDRSGRMMPVLAGTLVVACLVTSPWWWPLATTSFQKASPEPEASPAAQHEHADNGHDHGDHQHEHSEATSVELTPQARQSLGLTAETVRPIQLQTFQKTVTIPAVIVERPGRTHINVATPLTGVIEHVRAVTGEVVSPGSLLFEIRLTHEDLVQSQTDFLRALGELDVEEREIHRLNAVAQSGAVAGKTLLERQYAKERIEALLRAQREALRLHGLSVRQIEDIARHRTLLRELQILVPSPDAREPPGELRLTDDTHQQVGWVDAPAETPANAAPPLIMEQLNAQRGQSVAAGEQLCVLADYSRLYIEGQAFGQDSQALDRVLQNGWTVTALFEEGAGRVALDGLELAFISNFVDPVSRKLSFFVDLPNEVVSDGRNLAGQRFISWKYRVGQRLQLRVPVEEWQNQIVVPVEAVARSGVESYVFQENGRHFDRVPVHVQYRDQQWAVIANDGSLYPGDVVAMRGAHQLQMALQNQSSGPIDPHAGHNH